MKTAVVRVARFGLAGALGAMALPALAAEAELEPVPERGEVRDPRGPVSAEDLATGNIDVPGEPVHDNPLQAFFMADRFEYRHGDDNDRYLWDVFGYIGGDYNKFWVESEGEGAFGKRTESAELQLLYSRAVLPYWDVQVGARHDFRPDPSKWYGVLGIEGLAPLWLGTEVDLYVSEDGDVSGSAEVEYNQFLTQRLILQPRGEINWQAQDVGELGLGSGVTDYELGLRLRYEIVREFAPYVGVAWAQVVGDTADRLPDNADAGNLYFVTGIRAWF